MTDKFTIDWIDRGREPQVAPNPDFPDGKPIDISIEGEPSCEVDLPYPAKRCGVYVVICNECGLRQGITTAGRPDDPPHFKFPCGKGKGYGHA